MRCLLILTFKYSFTDQIMLNFKNIYLKISPGYYIYPTHGCTLYLSLTICHIKASFFFRNFFQSYAYRCTLGLLSKLVEYHCGELYLVLSNTFTVKQVESVKNIYTNVHYSVLNLNPLNTIDCQKPISIFLLLSVSFSLLFGVPQRNGLYSSFLCVPPGP